MANHSESKGKCQSAAQLVQKQRKPTNLLKFINETSSRKRIEGKKCRPQQMFGYGHESPQHFKNKFSLKADNCYIFKFDEHPANENYQYFSQKHFVDIGKEGLKQPETKNRTQFMHRFKNSMEKNKLAFHRKKGKLSEFMDKNGWMSKNFKIMGYERCQTARECNNLDRQRNIDSKQEEMRRKRKGMSVPVPRRQKFAPPNSNLGQFLITEKVKTRQLRNQFATLQISAKSGELRPNTTMCQRGRSRNKDNQLQITSSLKLAADKKSPDFSKTADMWNREDSSAIRAMQWTKPDQWRQTTCGSKFTNTQSMMTNRKLSAMLK